MSKCSVFSTMKLNFSYWTLFCPKYCASAGEAPARAASPITAAATHHFIRSPLEVGVRCIRCSCLLHQDCHTSPGDRTALAVEPPRYTAAGSLVRTPRFHCIQPLLRLS